MTPGLPQTPEKTVIHCACTADIPKTLHWAIISTGSVITRGYDKGDPDETITFNKYVAYLDQALWKEEITRRITSNHNDFVAAEVKPATITTEVKVNID